MAQRFGWGGNGALFMMRIWESGDAAVAPLCLGFPRAKLVFWEGCSVVGLKTVHGGPLRLVWGVCFSFWLPKLLVLFFHELQSLGRLWSEISFTCGGVCQHFGYVFNQLTRWACCKIGTNMLTRPGFILRPNVSAIAWFVSHAGQCRESWPGLR